MSILALPYRPTASGAVPCWRAHGLALAVVTAVLLAIFARDAGDVVAIWWGSSSYEHCLVIPFILAWLVWLRRDALAAIAPVAWALPLGWIAAGAGGWLVGEAAGVAAARHLALAMMLQGAVAAILGRDATRVLAFPLAYALFLVPLGDALVPPLQTITARLCMALLAVARVPATLDGVFITTPDGWFKVAEACSGAKFLIAMAALGVLVAHLGFRSWARRAAFLAVCLSASILANGVRAFSTILVAQHVGAERAGGFDHIVYGWIFFACVIGAVMAVSWRFFDRDPAEPIVAVPTAGACPRSLPGISVAAVMIAAAAPAWSAIATRDADVALPAAVHAPAVSGWTRVGGDGGWRPRFDGADRILVWHYRDAAGATADVAAALYAAQGDGRELVGYGHGAADPDGEWAWAADVAAPPGWRGERIEAAGKGGRTAFTAYRAGGVATASPARVKLATLVARLTGGDRRAGAILVASSDPAAARRLALALGAPGDAIGRLLATAR